MRTQVFYKVKWPIFGIRYHVNQAILKKKKKNLFICFNVLFNPVKERKNLDSTFNIEIYRVKNIKDRPCIVIHSNDRYNQNNYLLLNRIL